MLAQNQASLDALESDDWVQTLLIDEVGRGVVWANRNLARFAPGVVGEWIWILDDDDMCMCPALVDELRAIAAEHAPDVVMVRGDYQHCGVLPEPWGVRPTLGAVGSSCFIVRRPVWQRYAYTWAEGELGADFRMIDVIFEHGHAVYWHDCMAMRALRAQSRGKPE